MENDLYFTAEPGKAGEPDSADEPGKADEPCKAEALEALYREYRDSVSEASFKNYGGYSYVWGCGNTCASVVMIGEAPGENEVKEGRPFVGKAGKILDEFLEKTSISRSDLFITNTIKYRLSRPRKGAPDTEAFMDESFIPPSFLANRPATEREIFHGAGFLARELLILKPRIVVTLGNVPLKAVNSFFLPGNSGCTVGELHGKPESVRQGGFDFFLFPLYHPASLIYDKGKRACYEEDLEKLKALRSVPG